MVRALWAVVVVAGSRGAKWLNVRIGAGSHRASDRATALASLEACAALASLLTLACPRTRRWATGWKLSGGRRVHCGLACLVGLALVGSASGGCAMLDTLRISHVGP